VKKGKSQAAMQDELDKLEKYRVCNVNDKEDKMRVVKAKCVYTWNIDVTC
jgi:hypothetical protein